MAVNILHVQPYWPELGEGLGLVSCAEATSQLPLTQMNVMSESAVVVILA